MPDLPGYGASAAISQNDKVSVGRAVFEALKTEVKKVKSNQGDHEKIKGVVIGHDRGARVSHHITVSGVENVEILGVCLIDIVRICSLFYRPGPLVCPLDTDNMAIGSYLDAMAALCFSCCRCKRNNRILPLALPR